MQASKTFIEILEDEIRKDLREEFRLEFEQRIRSERPTTLNPGAVHAAGRLETWLATHVGPIVFKTGKQPYGAPTKKNPPPPDIYAAVTTEDVLAVELLARHAGMPLSTRYTNEELKAVWRKAALKSHPDRFVGADEITVLRATALFRELASAYELLSTKSAA